MEALKLARDGISYRAGSSKTIIMFTDVPLKDADKNIIDVLRTAGFHVYWIYTGTDQIDGTDGIISKNDTSDIKDIRPGKCNLSFDQIISSTLLPP